MNPHSTYRVVRVRADGSRAVVAPQLSRELASYLKDILSSAEIFAAVLIELNDDGAREEGN
jgi:hypothetical protein